MRKTIKVSNITCTNCAKSIEEHFKTKEDITARVNVSASSVVFDYNEELYNEDYLYDELLDIGYYGIKTDEEQARAKRKDMIDLLIAFIFSLPLLYTMFEHLVMKFIKVPNLFMNGYFQMAMTIPVLFIAGRRFFVATYHSLKERNLGMDSLVVIGTVSAFIYSTYDTVFKNMENLFFETSAVIIFMVLLGNYFENRIKERTSSTLTGLLNLGSKQATLLINNEEILTNIEDVKIGDIVVVKGYDKIPIDGVIVSGKTYVDESMLTGESMPVTKTVGDEVIGSSMNLVETIHIKVTKVGSDTVLSKIIQTVEETSLIKPKAQRIADKISSVFVPIVIVIATLVMLIYLLVLKEPFADSLMPAVAVLVVSCPCALGLATPTSISVSSGMAFKESILYKGGEFFETANKITAIAFDKTGTLTHGRPTITNYLGEKKYLKFTVSLEKHSNHPIANAFDDYYDGEYLEVTNYETLIGYGIKGSINNEDVLVVSNGYLKENNIIDEFCEVNYYYIVC